MSATREKWIVVLFASSVRPPPIALGEKNAQWCKRTEPPGLENVDP